MHQWVSVVVACALLAICGCNSESAHIERVTSVSGTLTFQGKPLEFFQVTFLPEDGRRPAVGITDASGKFKLGTNEPEDGAPPGLNKIAIVWVGPPSTIQAGMETTIDDPAKLPKPKIRIPAKYNNPETSSLKEDVPAGGLSDLKIDLK